MEISDSNYKAAEKAVRDCYRKLDGIPDRFGYEVTWRSVEPGALPFVLFVGNHSSGKSTYINHLLGGESVQDTGIAPTDDCFTVIQYSDVDRDYAGDAALLKLGKEYGHLRKLGPRFLDRLRVKGRNREILKKATLVDSPGMLDSNESDQQAVRREYDFFGALSMFAGNASLVVLMFDPEKPGTTGETMDALSGPLANKIPKLRILLNKCDVFDSTFDYVRAYGALCWNLAYALRVKDVPKIAPCRVPTENGNRGNVDVAPLDRTREALDAEILNSRGARVNMLIDAAAKDCSQLEMQIRVISNIDSLFWRWRLAVCGVLATAASLVAYLMGLRISAAPRWTCPLLAFGFGIVLGEVVYRLLFPLLRKWCLKNLARRFESTYLQERNSPGRSDIDEYWLRVEPHVRRLLQTGWHGIPLCCWWPLRKVRAAKGRLLKISV